MQNVYLDHPITIQPSPVPQQLDILQILAIGPGAPCYAAVMKQGPPVQSPESAENRVISTIQTPKIIPDSASGPLSLFQAHLVPLVTT